MVYVPLGASGVGLLIIAIMVLMDWRRDKKPPVVCRRVYYNLNYYYNHTSINVMAPSPSPTGLMLMRLVGYPNVRPS